MGKVFERVVIVFLENTLRSSALANPYLNALRKKGVFMTNAQGVHILHSPITLPLLRVIRWALQMTMRIMWTGIG